MFGSCSVVSRGHAIPHERTPLTSRVTSTPPLLQNEGVRLLGLPGDLYFCMHENIRVCTHELADADLELMFLVGSDVAVAH